MSDFLERNGLQTVAQHFKDLFLASVHRDGAEELLERLENETDFFRGPGGSQAPRRFPRWPGYSQPERLPSSAGKSRSAT